MVTMDGTSEIRAEVEGMLPPTASATDKPSRSREQSEDKRHQRGTGKSGLLALRDQALCLRIEQRLARAAGVEATAIPISTGEGLEESTVRNDLEELRITRADRKHRLALVGGCAAGLDDAPADLLLPSLEVLQSAGRVV